MSNQIESESQRQPIQASVTRDIGPSVERDESADIELTESSPQTGPEDGDEGVSEPLPLDQIFEILRNQRRRYVLEYLDGKDGSVTLRELAEQLTAWENDKEPNEITSAERKRVYVGLYQCHLPKMDSTNVISFNKPRGIIEPGEHIDIFEQYLESNEEPNVSWHQYYFGLSLVGVASVSMVIVLAPMMTFPITEAITGLLVAAFFICSMVNAWHERQANG